jgi:isoleucyl-tRNA synthetase
VDDFNVGLKYQLPVENPVGSNGVFLPDTEIFAGQFVFKANTSIVEKLVELGRLVHQETLMHSYPHCWRHHKPIIFRATPQWFIGMDKKGLREMALKAIPEVKWIPDWGAARIRSMIDGRPDWCISRQRTWGVPLAIMMHKKTGEVHPDSIAIIEKVAQAVEKSGIQAWFDMEPEALLGDDSADYEKVVDTLDVWMDSGVSHNCVLAQRDNLNRPADLYLEGSDQHRGWFQSSLLSSLAMDGTAPYKQVLTHGFVVDAKGMKMSKSKGNVMLPKDINNNLGADILRLWVASTDYQGEMAISKEILNRTADSYRRIRNTSRFLLANTNDFNPANDAVEFNNMLPLDQWAVAYTQQMQDKIIALYDNYDFHGVVQLLHHFCSESMGGFYLDIIKDRQYTSKTGSHAQRSCQSAMHLVIEALVRWMTPILSFTADEIWQLLPDRTESTPFQQTWFDGLDSLAADSEFSLQKWEQVLELKTAVNKALELARKEGVIGGSLEAEVMLCLDEKWQKVAALLGDEIRFILITSAVEIKPLAEASGEMESDIEGVKITVSKSVHEKCERCWHRQESVGKNPEHPDICLRCVENVVGDGEVRMVG